MGGFGSLEVFDKSEKVLFCLDAKHDEPKRAPGLTYPVFARARGASSSFSFTLTENLKGIENEKNYGCLPLGVLNHLFQFFTIGELSKIFRTCKLFHRIVHTDHFWKTYFEAHHRKGNCCYNNWKYSFFDQKSVGLDDYFQLKFLRTCWNPRREQRMKFVIYGDWGVGKTSLLCRWIRGEYREHQYTSGCIFLTQKIPLALADDEEVLVTFDFWDNSWNLNGWRRDAINPNRWRQGHPQPLIWRGAVGHIVCFSVCDRKTFEDAKKWVKFLQKGEKVTKSEILLVGTKVDVDYDEQLIFPTEKIPIDDETREKRNVSFEEVLKYMKRKEESDQQVERTQVLQLEKASLEQKIMKEQSTKTGKKESQEVDRFIGYVETSAKRNHNVWTCFGVSCNAALRRLQRIEKAREMAKSVSKK